MVFSFFNHLREHKILTKTAQMDLNNIDKALRRREREKDPSMAKFYCISRSIILNKLSTSAIFLIFKWILIIMNLLIYKYRYHKAHRQTVYLSNRGVKEFYKDGYILCNNNNRNILIETKSELIGFTFSAPFILKYSFISSMNSS